MVELLPLTPVSEERDGLDWIRGMYPDFAASCTSDCVSSGWSIQQLAVLATGGHAEKAFDEAKFLPLSVFETSGGDGHSLSNTLWYISTRPTVDTPIALPPPVTTTLPPEPTPLPTIVKTIENVEVILEPNYLITPTPPVAFGVEARNGDLAVRIGDYREIIATPEAAEE